MSMLLLLLVVFVGPTSHIIRGADAFTHIMRLLGPRCNYYERHQHHCHLTTSHYVVSSTAVENQDILHEKANIDEHYNSINTQRKKEKQNHNNDNSNIQPHLRKLLQLCRPINFPVVVNITLAGRTPVRAALSEITHDSSRNSKSNIFNISVRNTTQRPSNANGTTITTTSNIHVHDNE